MAAAYAAVVSLVNTMDQIRNHPRLSACFDKRQFESLGEHLDFLLEYLESYSFYRGSREEVEDLDRLMASAAQSAEDVIESHIVDRILAGSGEGSQVFLVDLQKIIAEMSLLKEEVAVKFRKSTRDVPHIRHSYRRTSYVGLDEFLQELQDRLIGVKLDRAIIPIVGPGGMGKTTLARHAFTNRDIMKYFYPRAWANVSNDPTVRETLLQLLLCIGGSTNKLAKAKEDELVAELHRVLSGARYLIVLDDIRSGEAWDRIKCFFPENNKGSRIIVTSRRPDVASHISSDEIMTTFLNADQSWNLFCETVFGGDRCPMDLERIGRVTVQRCNGLPLLISVIGGVLSRSSFMSKNLWEYIAIRIGSPHNVDEVNRQQNIIMLAYDALLASCKPCFLYMGMFPEECEIHVSRLIKLWVAEGFLKPNSQLTLEEVGENCILQLADWSLISVTSRGLNAEPKTCKVNDYARDICTRVAEKEKFFSFMKTVSHQRRFVLHDSTAESALLAHSLVSETPAVGSLKSRSVRVLVEDYSDSLEANFEQVNLRFLARESIHAPADWIPRYELPSSISLLWNMQVLIIGKKFEIVVAPIEIWEMRQLRHLDFNRLHIADPPSSDDEDDSIMQNLHILRTAVNLDCSEEVCKRMPNVKKLRVFYDDFHLLGEGQRQYLYHLLAKLESLDCCFLEVPNRDDLVEKLKFPSSLKKLVLQGCELQWSDLSIIGSLPFLENLKLKPQSVRGPTWETVEDEFCCLKYLEIDSCYLINWCTESSHFPVLQKLVLSRMYRLREIPLEMGEIPTLEEICVVECSISSVMSGVRIMHYLEQLESFQLQVRVRFRNEEEAAEFAAKVKSEGLKSSSLRISGV